MIGRGTLLSFVLAAVTGYGMYQLTYDVVGLEEELGERNRQILARQEAIHVLNAEWAYLNEPGRLQRLADRHLDLRPLSASQVVPVSALVIVKDSAPQSAPAAVRVPMPTPKPVLAALDKRGRR
jgi:hypothetical protein